MENKDKEIRDMFVKSPATYFAWRTITEYVNDSSNRAIKDGQRYKVKDLSAEINTTRQWANRHLHKLQEQNIIKIIGHTNCPYIVVNPEYYMGDETVDSEVYALFAE